ncbi:MAG: M14 family metallopeptidase [Acetivibrionales bacterium]
MKIGTAICENGKKAYGYIHTASLANGSEVKVPVMIARGVEDGPVLWINAGVHGEEISGIFSIQRLFEYLDPQKMKGAVVGTPGCNPLAIKGCNKFTPEDQLDLDQQFPGRRDGWLSEQMAYHFFNEVKANANYLLDLHALGGVSAAPYTVFKSIKDVPQDVNEKTKELALLMGITNNCFVDLSSAKGELPGPLLGALDIQCILNGIPALMVEMGAGNRIIWENVANVTESLKNALRWLGIIEGEVVRYKGQKIITKRNFPCNHIGGYAIAQCKAGDVLKAGDPIVKVVDAFGNVLEEMNAEKDVIVIGVIENPVSNSGKVVAVVGLEWEVIN